MATNNPLARLASNVTTASCQKHVIAGIEVDVYGVKELDPSVKRVACLWLLNPRLSNRKHMKPIADAVIAHRKEKQSSNIGVIVAAFDQRNHGSRLVDELSNQAWRDGNPRHAQDMFSIFQGTAADTSQLITYLSAFVFPKNDHQITENMALGISLGGHSVWQLLLHEPRVTTGVIVVGCPDYISLMTDRARLSKRKTWTQTSPPGSSFLGSEDFPTALVEAIEKYDPMALFFGIKENATAADDHASRKNQIEVFNKTLRGKRLLNLAGGVDKLVPYAKAEPFLTWLKGVTGTGGWYEDGRVEVRDIVYKGVGHEMTAEMLQESLHFLDTSLEVGYDHNSSGRGSKL